MENNEQHMLDIQSIRADILAINVKLDTNFEKYMEKLTSIEAQTIKTNGRVNGHDVKFESLHKIIWTAMGGGGVLLLLPTLNAIINKLAN